MNVLTSLSIALAVTLLLLAGGITVGVCINRLEHRLWKKRAGGRQPWSSR